MNKFLTDAGSNYQRMLMMVFCSLFLTRAMATHLGIDDFGRWSLVVDRIHFWTGNVAEHGSIAAEKCTAAEIERTSAFLQQSGVMLFGGVVTGIAEAYAERDVR